MLAGAGSERLRKGFYKYVLFEFSPVLMKVSMSRARLCSAARRPSLTLRPPRTVGIARSATVCPLELLKLLPAAGATCFDMVQSPGSHNKLPRPSRPLGSYLLSLARHTNADMKRPPRGQPGHRLWEEVGPWDDILCMFPVAASEP